MEYKTRVKKSQQIWFVKSLTPLLGLVSSPWEEGSLARINWLLVVMAPLSTNLATGCYGTLVYQFGCWLLWNLGLPIWLFASHLLLRRPLLL